jgi:hypothetical protein
MPISDAYILKIIEHFLPGDPLSYKLHDDGSLVVVADTGKKHTFTADQVTSVYNFIKPKAKPAPAADQAPMQSKTRTTKGPAASKPASKPKSTA